MRWKLWISALLGLAVLSPGVALLPDVVWSRLPSLSLGLLSTTAVVPVRDAPAGTVLDVSEVPVRGARYARVMLIEFADYECPFCARYTREVAPSLEETFVATGKIQRAVMNNPLPIHTSAPLLATAAICAAAQGSFWEMHSSIYASLAISRGEVEAIADDLALNMELFQYCLDYSEEPRIKIERETAIAKLLALNGTPGFAIGILEAPGRVRVRRLVVGAHPGEVFEDIINELLVEAEGRMGVTAGSDLVGFALGNGR